MKILKESKLFFNKISVVTRLIAGISVFIIAIALFLMLPISTRNSLGATPLNAFYTSVSAFTLCGESFAEGSSYWTGFGLTVIALCIQAGAFSIMTISVVLFLMAGQLLKIKFFSFDEYVISANKTSLKNIIKYIALYMTFFEILGAVLYFVVFIPAYGTQTGILYSIFTSLSVFTNCGMKALPAGASAIFNSNILYNIITFILSFIGGVGFIPISELVYNKSLKKLEFNSALSLYGMLFWAFVGGIIFFIAEYSNVNSIGSLAYYTKTAAAFNMTQTLRCAQIGSFDFSAFTYAGKTLVMLLMLTGSAQYSFSGGLHISTVFGFWVFMLNCAKCKEDYEIWDMSFERNSIKKAVFITALVFMSVFVFAFSITMIEDIDFFVAFFETVSAFTLSGITLSSSILMSSSCKIILMICMLLGRFGFLYMVYRFENNKLKLKSEIIKIKKPTNLTV